MSEEKRKNPLSVYWIYIAFVIVLVSTHLYINSETTSTIKYKNYTRPPILQMESPEHRSMNNFTYSLSSDDNDISSSQSSSTFSRYFNAMQSPKNIELK